MEEEIELEKTEDIDEAVIEGEEELTFAESDENSEHHHHHHHHHRHHHSSKKKGKKIASFFKRNKSVIINIVSCTISVVLLVVLAFNVDSSKKELSQSSTINTTNSTINLETSVFSKEITLVSDAVAHYMSPENEEGALAVYKKFAGYKGGLNYGLPVTFVYNISGLPSGVSVASAELLVSENADCSEPLIYKLDLSALSIDIYNLKTGTQYYYCLSVVLTDDCVINTTGSFKTAASPRILKIEGAENVRDIGGWKTTDNKTIRQGLLYRGSELDGAVKPDYNITENGLQQMTAYLGVKYDMDLRSEEENKSGINALGQNVVHRYYGAPMYSDAFNAANSECVRKIFSDLAKPQNYPLYMHCTYGRDRTGTVCYLLEALLGLSDEDLRREYELSAFTDSYIADSEFNILLERIASFEGRTTKQKVENYLLSVGVTNEEIKTIREIFLAE